MIIWKSVNNTEGKEFDLGHPQDQAQSQIRKTHYANSRMALLMCLQEVEPDSELSSSDLEITGHHFLSKRPHYLCSLAHTRDMACACLIHVGDKALGVGIDCERSDRVLKPEVLSKFSCQEDHGQSPLHLWCAKEAAFKASSYHWSKSHRTHKTFVLKDIQVRANTFEISDLLKGRIEFHQDPHQQGFLIALAIVTDLYH